MGSHSVMPNRSQRYSRVFYDELSQIVRTFEGRNTMPKFQPDKITQTVKDFEDESKYGASNGQTRCNFFVCDVVESLLQQTRPEFHALANIQYDNLLASPDWQEQNLKADIKGVFQKAQDATNQGEPVIVAYQNPTGGHGHIAIVVPAAAMEQSSAWGMKVPFIAQAGNKNPRNQPSEANKSVFASLKLSFGFPASKKDTMEIFILN